MFLLDEHLPIADENMAIASLLSLQNARSLSNIRSSTR